MKKIWKKVKRYGSVIVGLAGFGGSLSLGSDYESAILIGSAAAIVILTGEVALAEEFIELFEKDSKEEKSNK